MPHIAAFYQDLHCFPMSNQIHMVKGCILLSLTVRQLAKKHRMSLPTFSTVKDPVPSKETSTKTGDLVPTSEPEDKMEIPVAYGRWGKPKCLREAKYDFLILDAIVASTRDPLDRVQIGKVA